MNAYATVLAKLGKCEFAVVTFRSIRTKDPQGKWVLTDEERLALMQEARRRVGDEFDVTISNPDTHKNLHVELDPQGPLR